MKQELDKQTQTIRKRYDRFSRFYDILEKPMEAGFMNKWRQDLVGDLTGKILEIGVGTGKNLEYYPQEVLVTAIDISPGMLGKAKKKLKNMGNKNLKLVLMDAQNLKLKDNSFDNIVCTFVLCSVPDPLKTLGEMKRVVKKDGNVLMLEHVLSKHLLIRLFQYVHNPITRFLFGFNVSRDTVGNIRKSGLKIKKEKNLAFFDVFKRIEAVKSNSGGKK